MSKTIKSVLGSTSDRSLSNLSAELRRKRYLSESDFIFQDFEPQVLSAAGSAVYTINRVAEARYMAIGSSVQLRCSIDGTTSGAAGLFIRLVLPFSGYTPTGEIGTLLSDSQAGVCPILDGIERKGYWRIPFGANFIEIFKHDLTNWGIGGSRLVLLNLNYERI